MHWCSVSVRRQHPGFLQTLVLTLGHRVCSWPLPAQAAGPRLLPVTAAASGLGIPAAGTGPEGSAAPASERTSVRGPGCSPPHLHLPVPSGCAGNERVRRAPRGWGGGWSFAPGSSRCCLRNSAPQQQPWHLHGSPQPRRRALAPRPSLAGFVALRWRETTAPPFALRVGPTLSIWQTHTGTNQEQDSRPRRECGWLVRSGTLWWYFSRVAVA